MASLSPAARFLSLGLAMSLAPGACSPTPAAKHETAAHIVAGSPERRLGTPEKSLATATQRLAMVATVGSEHWVVYSDERAQSGEEYATRVSSNGSVLDEKGFRLAFSGPIVATSPSGFLSARTECASGVCTAKASLTSWTPGAPSGTPVTLETSTTGTLSTPYGAYFDGAFVLVWEWRQQAGGNGGAAGSSGTNLSETHAMRLDAGAMPIDSQPVTLAGIQAGVLVPSDSALASFSGNAAAIIETKPELAVGTIKSLPLELSGSWYSRVAFGGGVYLLTWQDAKNTMALRLDSQLEVLGAPFVVAPVASPLYAPGANVAFVNGAFRVSWPFEDALGTGFRQSLVQPDGSVAPDELLVASAERLVWSSTADVPRAFGEARASPGANLRLFHAGDGSGLPLLPQPLSALHTAQQDVTLAKLAGGTVAAWLDLVDDERRVQVAQSSSPDFESTAWSRTLATLPSGKGAVSPSVAAAGGNVLVAWMESDPLCSKTKALATRVSDTGELVDAAPIVLAEAEGSAAKFGNDYFNRVAAASNGSSTLVAMRFGCSKLPEKLCAVRIEQDGTQAWLGCREDAEPAVTAVGGNYFIVWSGTTGTRGALLTPGTNLSGSHFSLTASKGKTFEPRIASDGKRALAVWKASGAGDGAELYAALVEPESATVVRSPFLVSAGVAAWSASVTFDGTRYWVFWRAFGRDGQTFAQLFDRGGAALGSAQSLLEAPRSAFSTAAVAIDGRSVLLGYAQLDDELGSLRARLRRFQVD